MNMVELVILIIMEKCSSIFTVLNSHYRCIVVHMICVWVPFFNVLQYPKVNSTN